MLNIDFVKYMIYLVCEEIFIYYKCTVYISCCIEAASAAFDAASKVPSTGEEAVSFEELPEAEKLKPLENPESELRPEIDGISLVVFPLHRMSSPNVVANLARIHFWEIWSFFYSLFVTCFNDRYFCSCPLFDYSALLSFSGI